MNALMGRIEKLDGEDRGVDAEAAELLDEIAKLQGPADRSALRVHPWRVRLERLTSRRLPET